jgi:hypothetical protein
MPPGDVLAGIDAVLSVGSIAPELVAIEARRIRDATVAPVIPITAALDRYDRPAPGLAGYDQLLATPAAGAAGDATAATVTMIGPCS